MMNNSPMLMHLANQMLGQAPMLVVYLSGMILCAARWRRAPRAALLALIGIGIMLFTTVTLACLSAYLIANQGSGGMPVARMGQILAYLSIGGSFVRAGGFALVLAAIFAQRAYIQRGFDVTVSSASTPV